MDSASLDPAGDDRDGTSRGRSILYLGSGLLIGAAFLAACLLLGLSLLVRKQQVADRWVDHTMEILRQTAKLEAALATAANFERAFVIDRRIIGDDGKDSRKRFEDAALRTEEDVARLRALTADNRRQQAALDLLGPVILQRLAVSRTIIHEMDDGNFRSALEVIRTHRGRILADQVASIIGGMEGEERRLLTLRRTRMETTTRNIFGCVSVFPALVLCGALSMTMMLSGRRRERRSRDTAQLLLVQTRQVQAKLEILNSAGTRFSAELGEDELVDIVVQAARDLTGAQYAALFKLSGSADGERSWSLASLDGAPREAFTRFGLPRSTTLFAQTFEGERIVRCDDVLTDPRYGSLGGMPPGHLPVRSYMAVPVVSRSGSAIGALLFGHSEPGRFAVREEELISGLSGQIAIALDNARLFRSAQLEQQRFRAAVQAVDGIVWTNDAHGRMAGEQPGWATLTGQSFDDYQGFGWSAAVHPDDVDSTMSEWSQAVAQRRPYLFEHRVRRRDGAWRIFVTRAIPVLEPEGGVREWVGVHTDISEQRQAEAANGRLAAIVTTASDAIVSFGPEDGRILTWNAGAERLFGYTESEAVGGPAGFLMPPDGRDADEPASVVVWAMEGREVIAYETVRVSKGGERIPVAVSAAQVRAPDGRIIGVSAIFHDLRPQQRAEKQNALLEHRVRERTVELEDTARELATARDAAERANKAKTHFVATMSHELRTPLNGILGYAHLLRLEGRLDPAQEQRVEKMLSAGQHLLGMINHVLSLAEIETEHVDLKSEEIDPATAVKGCLDLVRPAAAAKALALELVVAAGAPAVVVTDTSRLRQILVNLIGNAVKYTEHGTVCVTLSTSAAGAMRIQVADTGPGIPEQKRHRLFSDFQRLGDDTAAVEGTGLGLALAAKMATLLGGSLAYADNPGGGSIFALELPVRVDEPASTTIVHSAPSLSIDGDRKLNILVTDDVAMNREIACAFLSADGHRVTAVEDGPSAIAAVAASPFDVVLMDVRMPGMDGLEATRRIRILPSPQGQVLILALTAQAFSDQIEECVDAGMDGHMSKPFSPDNLRDAVARVIAKERRAAPEFVETAAA